MQHCATSSDREYLFQLEHRPANHEHTSASVIPDAHGPQEKIIPYISLLNGRLHDDLRNSVQTPLIHSAVQRDVGLLVLSRIFNGYDCYQHAVLMDYNPESIRAQIILR